MNKRGADRSNEDAHGKRGFRYFSEGPIEDLGPVDAARAKRADEQATTAGHSTDHFQVSADMRAIAEKAMAFAQKDLAISFDFARQLVRAQGVQDVLKLQADYVNAQVQLISDHARTDAARAKK
jgi:Phasin protein